MTIDHQTFQDLVHASLRSYHRDQRLCDLDMWQETALLNSSSTTGLAAAVRTVLDDALAHLEGRDPEATGLLRRRFLQREAVHALAAELNYAERTLYQKQEAALRALAEQVWQAELALRQRAQDSELKQQLLDGLPLPSYSQLFGVELKQTELEAWLRGEDRYWLAAVVGLGGMGKTALARAAVENLVWEGRFRWVSWITAQQNAFAWEQIVATGQPALSYDAVLSTCARALLLDCREEPDDVVERRLRAALRRQPALIVVDNLETAVDVQALVMGLSRLTNPTKVLLTSRERVGAFDQACELIMEPLGLQDAVALARHHARERNAQAVLKAPQSDLERLAQIAGGNPLAIKLVVGQTRFLPLNEVLTGLEKADEVDRDFYRFIFRASWAKLSDLARRLLLHMPLFDARGTTTEHLFAVAEIESGNGVWSALQELVDLSLLERLRDREGQDMYRIHRLTEHFVLSDLARDQAFKGGW